MTPWLIFLFIGAMDWGFYAYALIATEGAARIACMYTSSSSSTTTDSTTACTYALGQLKKMSNVTSCTAGSTSVTSSAPLAVSATSVTGPDGAAAAQVEVVYLTPIYMPMMGTLPQQITIRRIVEMRVN
jgi:hypothetical protein